MYVGHIISADGIYPNPVNRCEEFSYTIKGKGYTVVHRSSRILQKIYWKFFKDSQAVNEIDAKSGKIFMDDRATKCF